jgi:glyoxylase-like metal-dependent hydrolase (beta-lactamase superfamily II)
MYLVIDDASQEAAVVDPYDAKKISNAVKDAGVKVGSSTAVGSGSLRQVTTLITTHHHDDHSGGNEKFVRAFYRGVPKLRYRLSDVVALRLESIWRVSSSQRDEYHCQGGLDVQDWARHRCQVSYCTLQVLQ